MEIENNVLIKIDNCDINADGTFDFPKGVTSIGDSAFENCRFLKEIKVPEGVTTIGKYAFTWCASLKEIELPESVTIIEEEAFRCTSLEKIIIPNGVKSIERGVFYNCTSLTKVIISEGLVTIGDSAFERCIYLKKITIPKSVISIGNYSFDDCKALINLSVGNIDVIKLYESSKQTIDGVLFQIESLSDTAAFATLSEFFITDGNDYFKCNYKNNTFSIENATLEAEKYVQKVLVPLMLQIQVQRTAI